MTLTDTQLDEQRQLIERAKDDPAAFGEIFDAHYARILDYVTRRTGDVATAQDITSVVFMKALDGLGKFVWQGVPISAWLYRIAGNEIRMYYRSRRPVVSLDELFEDNFFELADETDLQAELEAAQDMLDRKADYAVMQAAIMELPVKYQEVLVLRYSEGKKMAEIARILNKKEGTVKSLLSRALERLRATLLNQKMQPFATNRIMDIEGPINSKKPQE